MITLAAVQESLTGNPLQDERYLLGLLASSAEDYPHLLRRRHTLNAPEEPESLRSERVDVPDEFNGAHFLECQKLLAQIYLAREREDWNPGLALMKNICGLPVGDYVPAGERRALANIHYLLARELLVLGDRDEALKKAQAAFELYRVAGRAVHAEGVLSMLLIQTISGTDNPYTQALEDHRELIISLKRVSRPGHGARSAEYRSEVEIAQGDFHFRVYKYLHRSYSRFNSPQGLASREFFNELRNIECVASGGPTYGFELDSEFPVLKYAELKSRRLRDALSNYEAAVFSIQDRRGPYHPSVLEPLKMVVEISRELGSEEIKEHEAWSRELARIEERFKEL